MLTILAISYYHSLLRDLLLIIELVRFTAPRERKGLAPLPISAFGRFVASRTVAR